MKIELESLLGEPSTENLDSWSYNLGPSESGINYGLLIIEFKETEVRQYKVIENQIKLL